MAVARLHASNWAWRDCKPANIIMTKRRQLRLIDFEGASSISDGDPVPWSTRAFLPPRQSQSIEASQAYDDSYAVGVTLYFLLSGRLPEASKVQPIETL